MINKLFFSLVLCMSVVYANVSLNIQEQFFEGDPVLFTFEINGSDIQLPLIDQIEGFTVSKSGSSSSLSIVNGEKKQRLFQQYRFFPNKTLTIPSFKVLIDGKEYFTQEKKLKKIKVKQTQSEYISYELSLSQKTLYVGEQTIFTLKFKRRRDFQVLKLGFNAPTFDGFWSKQYGDAKVYNEGDYEVQELKYVLFPQKSGKLNITALKMDLTLLDKRNNNMSLFGPSTQIKSVYSNDLQVMVKPLPQNISLIGEFALKDKLDKTKLKVGEAVNYEIIIEGRGNIDDIPELKLKIENATIYENKAIKTYNIIDDNHGGTYRKTYSIVANEDITIPEIVIDYFDKKSGSIKELKTKQYKIIVQIPTGQKKVNQSEILKATPNKLDGKKKQIIKIIPTSDYQKIYYFVYGVFFSSLIFGLIIYVITKKKNTKMQELPLLKRIRSSKSQRILLNTLLPYINKDSNLDEIIFTLDKSEKINLKELKKEIILIINKTEIIKD